MRSEAAISEAVRIDQAQADHDDWRDVRGAANVVRVVFRRQH
jgi:hypothetical protein